MLPTPSKTDLTIILHKTFLQPDFPREQSLHDHHVLSAPSLTCIFRIPQINGSRELPKTRVLTALTGACPTGNLQTHCISCAPEPAGSGHSSSSRLSRHSSCLPGGSPAWPRGTEAAQALPWTSVLENLEKQPVLLRGRVEEGEEQIIDRF